MPTSCHFFSCDIKKKKLFYLPNMSERMSRASNWTDTSSCFPMAPISWEVIFLHTLAVRFTPVHQYKHKNIQRYRWREELLLYSKHKSQSCGVIIDIGTTYSAIWWKHTVYWSSLLYWSCLGNIRQKPDNWLFWLKEERKILNQCSPEADSGNSAITAFSPMLEMSLSCSLSDIMLAHSMSTIASTWGSFTLLTRGARLKINSILLQKKPLRKVSLWCRQNTLCLNCSIKIK